MRLAIITILFGLGLAAPQSTLAQDGTEPASWGQALREDAKAFHDLVAENHPGPVDDQNPAFNASLEEGLALALDRARTADSYSAWRAALAEYAAAFNDGHLGLKDIKDNPAPAPINWPGFLVGLRSAPGGDHYEVAFNRDPAAPPVGAVLVSCDGRPAEALAQEMIGREAGRWSLRSTRVSHAVWSLVDTGTPMSGALSGATSPSTAGPRAMPCPGVRSTPPTATPESQPRAARGSRPPRRSGHGTPGSGSNWAISAPIRARPKARS